MPPPLLETLLERIDRRNYLISVEKVETPESVGAVPFDLYCFQGVADRMLFISFLSTESFLIFTAHTDEKQVKGTIAKPSEVEILKSWLDGEISVIPVSN